MFHVLLPTDTNRNTINRIYHRRRGFRGTDGRFVKVDRIKEIERGTIETFDET